MDKLQLLKLLALKDAPANTIQTSDAGVWQTVLAAKVAARRTLISAALAELPVESQAPLAQVDLGAVPPAELVDRVRGVLAGAKVAAAAIDVAVARLAPFGSTADDGKPIAADPDLAPLLAKARLYQIADIARLDDAVAEAFVPAAPIVNDRALAKLVAARALTDVQARAIGLAAALYDVTDEDAALAKMIQSATFPALGGRTPATTRDLAVLRAEDWSAALETATGHGALVSLPARSTPASVAAGLATRFAALHPDAAFVGRLPRPAAADVTAALTGLASLAAGNPAVVGAAFNALDVRGVAASELPGLQRAHATLRSLVATYPGLGLAAIADDARRTPAERGSAIARRIGLVERVHTALGGDSFLELDYSPGSTDLDRIGGALAGVTDDERVGIVRTLKAYQRTFALTNHVDHAHQILAAAYPGASAIGKGSLDDFIARTGFPPATADNYWRTARRTLAKSTHVVASLGDMLWGLFDRTRYGNVGTDARDYVRRLDGYATLFGSLSYCTCQHCDSVLGPAAYFVDVMTYIEENVSKHTFGAAPTHPLALKVRRGDLWKLELTCDNTDERIPTLVIVNEILESFVARASNTTPALVYDATLRTTTTSFQQPFHRDVARIDAYLAALDGTRLEAVRASAALPAVVAAAALRLAPEDWPLVTTRAVDSASLARLYDLDFVVSGGTVGAIDAEILGRQMGVSRSELGDLVATVFVAAGGATVRIVAEKRDLVTSIQNDIENVRGLTPDALDRMHRFVRLARALPWSIAELDRVLTALSVTTLDAAIVTSVAIAFDLQQRLRITVDETCALFGQLPKNPPTKSLFDRVFNPPDVPTIATLVQKGATLFHPAFRSKTPVPLDRDLPRLLAGLGIDLDELETLLERLAGFLVTRGALPHATPPRPVGPTRSGRDLRDLDEPDQPFFLVDETNLSLLYRHVRLARILGLSIEELFQLIDAAELFGHVGNLNDLAILVETHAWWRASGYTLDDIALAIGHRVIDATRYVDPDTVATSALAAAADALGFHDTLFAVALGVTETVSRDLLKGNPLVFAEQSDGRWRLLPGVDLATVSIAIPTGATIPIPSDQARGLESSDVATVIDPYRVASVVATQLAAALSIDTGKLRALATVLGRSFDEPALVAALDTATIGPISDFVRALRPLLAAFAAPVWDEATIGFVQGQPDRFGATLPALTASVLRAFAVYARLLQRRLDTATDGGPLARTRAIADLKAALFGYDSATAAFETNVLPALARVLGVNQGLVAGLRDRVKPPAAGASAVAALDVLDGAARLATRLGVDGAAFASIASGLADDLAVAAEALRAAIRRRHNDEDEAAQATALEAIDQPLRERCRDALVAYLLHSLRPRLFREANELVEYFLIDVMAGGCASTSRVVSATSSIQLYVERVLMRLERTQPDAPDPVVATIEPALAAAEWSWRKNYRVWEANRKIFLWPENYLEPDIRDDKTPLFEDLESELLQTEVTDQNVLDAYTTYLAGFEELAGLKIAGAYHDVRSIPKERLTLEDTLHLFAVASTDPPTFYYRTADNLIGSGSDTNQTARWSAWRKVNANIAGRLVSPVVFRNRLHVFWNGITTRPTSHVDDGKTVFDGYRHTFTMSFTTLRPDGRWLAPQPVKLAARSDAFGPERGAVHDTLRTVQTTTVGHLSHANVPLLDDRSHSEPIDDYTLSGPSWDWIWLDPAYTTPESLAITFRNFRAFGTVDLFERTIADGVAPNTRPTTTRVLSAKDGQLWAGTPVIWPFPQNGFANLVIEDDRLALHEREIPRSQFDNRIGLREDVVADQLPDTRLLLAIPGSPGDAILQTGLDVVMIQGSVTTDGSYVMRRIGTTLAHAISERLFVAEVDGLLATGFQTSLQEAAPPLHVYSLIQDRTLHDDVFHGAYAPYYREIFFHIPYAIANALNSRGRFEAAQRWYRYLFDPTAADDGPDRMWRYSEFRNQGLPNLHATLTDAAALDAYDANPANPFAIARVRTSAFQKTVVMAYVDNLLDWADQLFTQFTTESVNEALLLYVTASEILGPRPARLGECSANRDNAWTYETIAPQIDRDAGEEILIEAESMVLAPRVQEIRRSSPPPQYGFEAMGIARARSVAVLVVGSPETASGLISDGFTGAWKTTRIEGWAPAVAPRPTESTLAPIATHVKLRADGRYNRFGWSLTRQLTPIFCVPVNDDLLAYWDRVEDRLYKIRHCLDIAGQARELALFAPEIDPRLLARMRAEGFSLEDVLGATSGSLPPYRFLFLIDRAKAFAASLAGFGGALLAALEKKDGEELGRLRLVQQQNLSRMTSQIRRWDLEVAEESLAALQRQLDAATYRRDFNDGLASQNRSGWEIAQSTARHGASAIYLTESAIATYAAVQRLLPQIGSPFAMKYGGWEVGSSTYCFARAIEAIAHGVEAVAASTGLEAGFDRRIESWRHQKQLAIHEINQLNRSIKAAELRRDIATRSLAIHDLGIEQLDAQLELADQKFTSLGLYTFLATKLRRIYRDAYGNALALARLAEQAFRFERGDETSPGLEASYWDPSHAGLLAGEQLVIALEGLERRFLETNYRSLEIDQAFSLGQVDPAALVRLRETGTCQFEIGELFFDLFYPGHYKRRIRAVRLTIPCITGPYVNVGAMLRLTKSSIRLSPQPDRPLVEVPVRRSVSVATSTAQADAGVFELSFRDERYMPFEGGGAISTWDLSLPSVFPQFDYQTINDVIISIAYTAEDDPGLREHVESAAATAVDSVLGHLSSSSLARLVSLRQEFSSSFTRLLHSPLGTAVRVDIGDQHFPPFLARYKFSVKRKLLLLRLGRSSPSLDRVAFSIDGAPISAFAPDALVGKLLTCELPPTFDASLRGPHTIAVTSAGALAPEPPAPGDVSALDATKLLDVLLYLEYQVVPS